eukprot:Tamp_18750.p1 GENE.Tamp_18750~~Tamp_18750.p1  ORF type:complete len:305 (+),score=42.02 Tamp_18750:144-1058(+)
MLPATAGSQNTYNWLCDNRVTIQRYPEEQYGVYGDGVHAKEPWASDGEGPWFISEILKELPLLIAVFTRLVFQINYNYWSHVWLFVAGWQVAYAALLCCEEQGSQMKYYYGAMVMFLFSAWQRKMISVIVPFLFSLSSSPIKYAYATVFLWWYVWQRRSGNTRALASIAIPFLLGFILRFLLLVGGALYTFVFLGVTQTPLMWAFGERFPCESAVLERALTPIFIIMLVLIKDMGEGAPLAAGENSNKGEGALGGAHVRTHASSAHAPNELNAASMSEPMALLNVLSGSFVGLPFRLLYAAFSS